MHGEKQWARLCGLIYLVVVATGLFALMYVPGQIVVAGDAAATLANIQAHQALYRAGTAALLLNQIAFLLLPLALYRLLAPVDVPIAKLMVLFALLGIPLTLVSAGERMVILDLINADPQPPADRLSELVALSRLRASNAMLFAWTFWGLWLLPFGYLVFRSGFLPRVLGALLMLGCAGYLANLFGHLLIPGHSASPLASFIRLPATIGEIGICLWLLIVGRSAVTADPHPRPE